MIRNRKAQFYIFAAILLCVYAATLIVQKPARPAEDSFSMLYGNYMFEAPKVINSALYNGTSPSARIGNFTDTYIAFARSSEPMFGVLYAYSHDGVTEIGSRLKDMANISTNTTSLMLKDNATMINGTWFRVGVGKRQYVFNLTKESRFQALFMSKNDQGAKVFKG